MQLARSTLERLKAFALRLRENTGAARHAERQRLFPTLIEDCERLVEARRNLANDSGRLAPRDEVLRRFQVVATQNTASPAE
jgi:hypothetical protein